MAQAETIKEFLVGLGFKVDEQGLKKFSASIGEATKNVTKLVLAVEGAALTVGYGVARFASSLEALYFAAIKTGSSAASLKAFEKAAQNFGASSEEALGSVQALARFMRNSPGSEGFIKSLGVDTRKTNGQLRESVDIMADLGKAMQDKPYYMANQYAQILGISEDTMRAMLNGDFAKELAAQKKRMANVGFQKATEDAHAFSMALREVSTYIESIAVKVGDSLFKSLGIDVKNFGDWFNQNGDLIAQRITEVIELLIKLAKMTFPALKWLAEKLINLDEMTDGWSTKLIALIAIFNLLGGTALISGLVALSTTFFGLAAAITAVAAAVVGLADPNDDVGTWIDEHIPGAAAIDNAASKYGFGRSYKEQDAASAVGYFKSQGWSQEQAAGIVGNLKNESSLDPNAANGSHYGVAQWDKNRQANFKAFSGKDIHGSSFKDQLEFINYELTQGSEQKAGKLLRASKTAAEASNIVFSQYERAGDATGARRANDAVQIAQTTNINVNGSSDPVATGKAVAGHQVSVNQDITRNLRGAIQ